MLLVFPCLPRTNRLMSHYPQKEILPESGFVSLQIKKVNNLRHYALERKCCLRLAGGVFPKWLTDNTLHAGERINISLNSSIPGLFTVMVMRDINHMSP